MLAHADDVAAPVITQLSEPVESLPCPATAEEGKDEALEV